MNTAFASRNWIPTPICCSIHWLQQQLKDGEKGISEESSIWSQEEWLRLRDALQNEGPRILDSLGRADANPGYILYKPQEVEEATDGGESSTTTHNDADSLPHADKILQEFQPVLLKQHEGRPHLVYDNFAAAVEDYFDHLQHQKLLLKAAAAEKAAAVRLEKVRADQQERLDALYRQQERLEQEAQTVQAHADNVDKALAVINSALDSGMGWDQLEQVVKVEQTQNRNPIALLIHKLDLEHDAMVLRLPTTATTGGDEPPTLDVRVSLKESAYANANTLFAKYRSSKEKSQKTIEASTKALKAAEETARKQLAEARKRSKQSAAGSVPGGKRKVLWFEKFHWFVTSDNYLVIAGRDAHQNELLVKRYLRPGDAYLHADVHGAASCILRAKRRRRQQHKGGTTEVVPLSEQALREAGNFTICRSSAWTSRMVTSAWWVESHQVSKTAPTGEYLTVGSFMIRGKKNFLPPTQLEMGLGVLFLLGDEDSILRHKNERRDFALLGDSEDDDEMENQSEKNGQEATANTNGRPHSTAVEKSSGSSQRPPKSVTNGEPVEGKLPTNGDTVDQSNDASGGAENPHDDDDDDDEQEPKGGLSDNAQKPKQKKRGLSARDRRLIKKYGSLEAAEKALAAREDDDQASEAPSTRSEVSTEPKHTETRTEGQAKKDDEKVRRPG